MASKDINADPEYMEPWSEADKRAFVNARRRYLAALAAGQSPQEAKSTAQNAVNESAFDVARFAAAFQSHDRYKRHIDQLDGNHEFTDSIKETVEEARHNIIDLKARSFVIYGQPQSGKTAMMIALTAALLDANYPIVIVLVNDNVQLLRQNLERFRNAGLDPAPRHFMEVLDEEISLKDGEWIVFCKKNANDLRKLIDKLDGVSRRRVILDDEADYATPNAKINRGEKTRINELVEKLIGSSGIYVGVTATPARLNLNNTFENDTERWVLFRPHPEYVGNRTFFPITTEEKNRFILKLIPDTGDYPKHIREAIFRFIVNVAYLNAVVNRHRDEQNYCMLIHTSGIRADHSVDYKNVLRTLKVLQNPDPSNADFARYFNRLQEIAVERYPTVADDVLKYIAENIGRNVVVVMNSSPNKANVDYEPATSPTTPFTIAIGGNIVSRGVTFNNLLSMFFTRDVKHKIQQDTYIQRARMFGSRKPYLEFFELSIPETLYNDWHRCFVYHELALESIKTGEAPVWLEDTRIAAVSPASMNRATVNMDGGEMSFDIFILPSSLEALCNGAGPPLDVLVELQALIGVASLPNYLIDFVKAFMPAGDESIAIHSPKSIKGYTTADQAALKRRQGFMGQSDLELGRFPRALHHFKVFYNAEGKARVFYKFTGNIRFLKNMKVL